MSKRKNEKEIEEYKANAPKKIKHSKITTFLQSPSPKSSQKILSSTSAHGYYFRLFSQSPSFPRSTIHSSNTSQDDENLIIDLTSPSDIPPPPPLLVTHPLPLI